MKRAAVGLFGAAMVAAAIVSYPLDPSLRFEGVGLGWPHPAKLAMVLVSCACLLVLDLAAYAAGHVLYRTLRPAGPRSLLAWLERMGLGFLVLAYGVLAMAALHGLHRPWIAGAVVVLALAGGALAWRQRRVPGRPTRLGWLVGAGAALLLVSPFLAAWVPDYGWDAFAYHLALPERYLFRNRIVVTPLFPHSAFPQTVEMLYLIALSVDSGALAKLVHLQFGALTALAVFAVARSVSARAGLLAVAILAADPLFNWELSVAYNDLAATLFAVLAAAAFAEWRWTNAATALRVAAVFAGACIAVRYTAGLVLLAMLALVWRRRPWVAWRGRLAVTVTLGGIAALVVSPWLVRNLVFTGNPVAPAAQSVFHASGAEYFSPLALEQSVAFARSVGFGRGLDDLVLLPVNLTLRARIGDYAGFGFRVGVLYVVGVVCFLVMRGHRVSTAAATALKLAGIVTLLWFVSLPGAALPPAGAVLDRDRGWSRPGRDPSATARPPRCCCSYPLAALVHTQWSAALLLPWRYGYALGAPVRGRLRGAGTGADGGPQAATPAAAR